MKRWSDERRDYRDMQQHILPNETSKLLFIRSEVSGELLLDAVVEIVDGDERNVHPPSPDHP